MVATKRIQLTALREARRWSRSELARRARMSSADVGKIEVGRLIPYDPQLRKLARALGVPLIDASRLLEAADVGGRGIVGGRETHGR
jgi:ribosome-binding protein aMBF1 (putative translation factor)